ncbi:MAG: L,D-transpeptidase family protein, partial [Myxococcales bacterium]|nr:L,D-transpeptidase family protein [Myxococcales bacterium]
MSALAGGACDTLTKDGRAEAETAKTAKAADAELPALPADSADAELSGAKTVLAAGRPATSTGAAEAGESPVADAPGAEAPTSEPAPAPRLGAYVSQRTTIAYAEPAWGSDIRGRIDPGTPFWVESVVDAEGCEESTWAKVGLGGYVCLRNAEESDDGPQILPVVPEGEILPFIYAKPKQDRKGNLEAIVPRYRSFRHLRRERGQVDTLVANRQYAFVEKIRRPSVGHVYVDPEGQAVPGRDLEIQKPTDFFGRDLREEPAAPGLTAAWAVSLPTVLRDKPSLRRRSKEVGAIDYHERFDVDPEPIAGSGVRWYRIPGAGKDGADAFAEEKQIRFWDPGPPMEGVGDDEVWLDVDIKQQILAVRRGQETQFITLISSGTGKHPTPRGIFRIRNKLALGKMENKPDDPDSYYVEGVPWVQYFYKRYALHATYWHRGVGRRRSHGCINLAPRDAAYVFSLTTPHLPEGWISGYEHADEVGTVIRIRRLDDELLDRRRPIGEEEDEDEEEPPEGADGGGEDEDEG